MINDCQPEPATEIGLSDREEALLRACVLSLQSSRRLYDLIEDEIAWHYDEFEFLEGLQEYHEDASAWPISAIRTAIQSCGIGTTDGDLERWIVARARNVTIRYASAEGQAESIDTVVVPQGRTDDDIQDLFQEWQVAFGRKTGPDTEDEDEARDWCEMSTDLEFVDWLVKKHGFQHFDGSGEPLTLVW